MTKHQTLTIEQAFELAKQYHQTGELPQAEKIYQQLLRDDPKQPIALHLLGIIAYQVGKHDIAYDLITKSISIRPDNADSHSNLGLILHDLGRFDEAMLSYNKALNIKPNFADVHYNLGNTFRDIGNYKEAWASYRKAIAFKPNYVEAHYNLGSALKEQDKFDEAITCYNIALKIKPNYADAHFNLGLVFDTLGQWKKALASYNKSIAIKPDNAEALYNIGNVFRENGLFDMSVVSYNKAITIKPDFYSAYYNLGIAHQELGDFKEAVENYKKAIAINFDFSDAYYNLGNVLQELASFDEAVSNYNKAIAISPNYAKAHNNSGNALRSLGKPNSSVISYNKAIAINPNFPEAHNNLGNNFQELGKLNAAVASYNKAIMIKPNYPEAHSNLGVSLKDLGMLDEAMSSFKKALKLKPNLVSAYNNLLNVETYRFSAPSETYKNACRFGKVVTRSATPISNHSNCLDPKRQLRGGFVSGDFCHHPIGYLLLSIFLKINTNKIELFLYMTSYVEDDYTARFKSYVSGWKKVVNKSDKQLSEIIVTDAIDILVDLSGHSGGNRLPLFALKPAPVQVTWIGSNVTTGIKEIDYILCDQWTIPKSEEKYFVEKPWRLPNTWLCFTPPEFDIKEGALPALDNGFITFGCFNNLTKINKRVIKCWANVLRAIPSSRLFLKTFQLNNMSVRENSLVSFEKYGISKNRLLLEGSSSRAELLTSYQNIDIALDPFPYTGGISSMESLWMGVPVLSVNGGNFVFSGFGYHVAESTLHNVGLSNWIASSPKNIAIKAKYFSSDLIALSKLRKNLRKRLLGSPLCDNQTFADNLTDTFQTIWKIWCDQTKK